jgi:hypothetical protein
MAARHCQRVSARAARATTAAATAGPVAGPAAGASGWLHGSYRVGAIAGGLATIGMAFPGPLWTAQFQAPFDRNRPELAYGMRAGAPLMGGWTLLLLWADRRPVQRSAVLPLAGAVVLGQLANDTAAARAGQVTAGRLLPARLLQAALLGLFARGYLAAAAARRAGRRS